MPRFSVIIATYNRGKHILPTLHSALQQTHKNFEILIIGDCCTDDTAEVVKPYLNDQVHWENLPVRCGSQSNPNNFGISMAQGDYISYLGHDDIWTSNHLSELANVFESEACPDFAVSGCIYHKPRGSGFSMVVGIFDSSEAANNFFPPSSLAHTVEATGRFGKWRAPETIRAPVDVDFQSRALSLGLTFASTQRVTVHKFAAGHRYLSYLQVSSTEQTRMLQSAGKSGFQICVDKIVEDSKQHGTFMNMRYESFERYDKGHLFRQNAQNKGNLKPRLRRFHNTALITQGNDHRALDWHPLQRGETGLRWSGPNPCPKVLIPFCGDDLVVCSITAFHINEDALKGVRIRAGGRILPVSRVFVRTRRKEVCNLLKFTIQLKQNDYTVLEIQQPDIAFVNNLNGEQVGIGVANIELHSVALPENFYGKLIRLQWIKKTTARIKALVRR